MSERQKDMISFAPTVYALSKLTEKLKTAETHTHSNTCRVSFNSLYIHYRVNGSESQGKGASKTLPPAQKGALILGQGALSSSLCGGWRVVSHTIVQCLTGLLLGTCITPTVS